MITEEDDEVKEYLHKKKDEVENRQDEVGHLIWKIEDTIGTWDDSVAQINEALIKKAEQIGISKSKFKT